MEPLLNDKRREDRNGYGTNLTAPGMSLNNDGQNSDGSGGDDNEKHNHRTRDYSQDSVSNPTTRQQIRKSLLEIF